MEKRFNVSERNVIEARLANFNLLSIKAGEKATDFVNVGVTHEMLPISIEGRVGRQHYIQRHCNKADGCSNLTWDSEIRSLTVTDSSITLKN